MQPPSQGISLFAVGKAKNQEKALGTRLQLMYMLRPAGKNILYPRNFIILYREKYHNAR